RGAPGLSGGAARLAGMPTAAELFDLVFDPGTWSSWDTPAADPPIAVADPEYPRALAAARERTGLDESGFTGEGRLDGRRGAAGGGWRGWRPSSTSSAGRWARRRLPGWSPRCTGPLLRACRCSPPRPPAAPGYRRAPWRSRTWSGWPRRSAGMSRPACRTWC